MSVSNGIHASPVIKAIVLLTCSALLFSLMGVCIRLASATVDNATIVFFRNVVGLMLFVPIILKMGLRHFKTERLWMHTWRSIIGVTAMYGFFYAIAHLNLSNAMVFTYSSPIFIPLIAWLFLKEKINIWMGISAAIGLAGVIFVAKPDSGMLNLISLIGISASFLAAMAFVTVRALTSTEPPERIVFYFCFYGTLISIIPMFWLWRSYNVYEWSLLIGAGILANVSQFIMSHAYRLAPAGQIGPVNYIAIVFAGIWGYLFWQEQPDFFSIIGFGLIFLALILCHPWLQRKIKGVR